MKNLNALWVLTILSGCATHPVTAPAPEPVMQPTPLTGYTPDAIKALAAKSSCAKYSWKSDQGVMPLGFIQGVALTYAHAYCHKTATNNVALMQAAGTKGQDCLVNYGLPNDGTWNAVREIYTLLFGVGVLETSGRYCIGRDMTADFSSADSAEAGLVQASWGAHVHSPELTKLFIAYQDSSAKCFLDTFAAGVSCSASEAKNWGTGTGADWQKFTKSCPAFAVEYGALVMRTYGGNQGEFGTMYHKQAEYRPDCESLLRSVELLIDSSPQLCGAL